VSAAFIQSKLDSNHSPVHWECAEGYEDRRKYVHCLHRHLYGMKDSPRGWGQLFAFVCTDFGLTRLQSDECAFVKFVNNSKTWIQNEQSNLANMIEATTFVPKNDRIYYDCPHATAILIIATYVNDKFAITNCATLSAEFEVHCNVKFPMNAEGPVNYRRSVSSPTPLHHKLLKKWGMEQCNPLPTLFPQKKPMTSCKNSQNLSQFTTRNSSKNTKLWLADSSICKYTIFQKYPGQYRY